MLLSIFLDLRNRPLDSKVESGLEDVEVRRQFDTQRELLNVFGSRQQGGLAEGTPLPIRSWPRSGDVVLRQ
jgi:hypothetical protein